MKSASFSVKGAFGSAFKSAARRQLPGAVTAAAVCAAASFLCAVSHSNIWSDKVMEADILYGCALAACWVFAALCIYNLFAVHSMFRGVYSRRACDYHLALPYKRAHIFNANFLFGLLVNLGSMLLSIGALYMVFIPVKRRGLEMGLTYSAENTVPLQEILTCFAAALVIYSVLSLCAALAGRSIQYYFLCYVLIVCVPLLIVGVVSRINLVWGVFLDPVKALIAAPAGVIFALLAEISPVPPVFTFAVCAAEFAVLYAVGIAVFKNRPAESAEDKLSGKIMPAVMFALFIASGLLIFNSAYKFLSSALFSIVTAFICLLIFRAVCRGTEKLFTKKIVSAFAGVCAVCVAFTALMYFPAYNSYTKYVPQADEVESVTVSENSYLEFGNEPASLLMAVLFGYSSEAKSVTLTQPENIQSVIDFHTLAVRDEVADYSPADKLVQEITDGYSVEEPTTALQSFAEDTAVAENLKPGGNINCIFEYKLKNGKTVERSYSIAYDLWYEYIAMWQNREAILQNGVFDAAAEDVIYIEGNYFSEYDEEGYATDSEIVVLPASQWNELKETVIADKLAENPYSFYSGYFFNGDICVYGINPALPQEEKEKIRNMTQEEKYLLVQKSESWVYYGDSEIGMEESEKVICYYIEFGEDDVNTLSFIRQFASR